MRSTSSRSNQLRAFTLIELLTVIAIIAVLAGLLFPAIKHAMLKAEIAQARGDIKNIEIAIRQFQTEYGKLPVPNADQGVCDRQYLLGGSDGFQYDVIDTLRAISTPGHANDNNALNPRRIVFPQAPTRKGAVDGTGYLFDPWGKRYVIKLDNNYNNLIGYYSPGSGCGTDETIPGASIIVSFGPDGIQQDPAINKADDIVNYK